MGPGLTIVGPTLSWINDCRTDPLTTYDYDTLGRQNQVHQQRTYNSYATTTYTFGDAGQAISILSPSPDGVQPGQLTTNAFDLMGRIIRTVLPDNTTVTNEYFPNGLRKKISGSRTYPVEYTYDVQGRMKSMKTWQNASTGSGAATTTWNYDAYRGWLSAKVYNDGHGPTYTYTPAGRLNTRQWVRGAITTYSYDNGGTLQGVSYSDSTPSVTYTLDRLGRQTQIVQTSTLNPQLSTTTVLDYSTNSLLMSESASAGPLTGLSVVSAYDQYLRRTNLSLNSPLSALNSTAYGYDSGRLSTVGDGTNCAHYSYLDCLPLVGQISFTRNGEARMTTTKTYDNLNRLTGISSSLPDNSSVSSAYTYNAANQRTALTNQDNACWVYQYDRLGQVISGKKYWSDGAPVAGQQFEYAFDDIGNRKTTGTGGDLSGGKLRSAAYSANALNQYTQRTVPGFLELQGSADSNATVSVWASGGLVASTTRKGDYFRAELPVSNKTAAAWLTLTNMAGFTNDLGQDIQTNAVGSALVLKTPQTFAYDADGNLTNDSRWTYTWDAENRLTGMETLTAVPAAARLKLAFSYDSLGRRIQKVASTWNMTTLNYQPSATNLFVYDGWNLIGELSSPSTVLRTYTWGLDLSGREQDAGGVGGLLFMSDNSTLNSKPSTHFVSYDGNGNVMTLVNAADGTLSAQYEYGPFGEVVRMTGPMAKANPFRFSTKYQDDESGLLYYGHRYYNASTGSWNSRDPIGEMGGVAAYLFVNNDGIFHFDVRGLWDYIVHRDATFLWAQSLGISATVSWSIGEADDGVDALYSVYNFDNWNWGWHFNRARSGDSRLKHRDIEVAKAKRECTNPVDNANDAAVYLGRALHPLQDWVAHADFNETAYMPNLNFVSALGEPLIAWHNFCALWYTDGQSGPNDPDDPGLDANGPDGRATMETLRHGYSFYNGGVALWTPFHPGHQRLDKTKSLTEDLLQDFQRYVLANGKPCGECKRAFLGGNQ